MLVLKMWYEKRLLYILLEDMDGGMNDVAEEIKKMWMIAANITNSVDAVTKSLDEYRRDFKLTFDNKFAKRVEEIVGLGLPQKDVMKIVGMDGKEHIVPIDKGW